MDDRTAFELTKREFSALHAFTAGKDERAFPIFFRPTTKEPAWPSNKAAHIVATDGHTLVTRKSPPFDGEEFWVSRETAGLLKGLIPPKGFVLLGKVTDQILFEVYRGRAPRIVPGCLFKGSFPASTPSNRFARGYVEFDERTIKKKVQGAGALATKYLTRLEAVRGAMPPPCSVNGISDGKTTQASTDSMFMTAIPKMRTKEPMQIPKRSSA